MKKIIITALCILLCISFVSCGEKAPVKQELVGTVSLIDGNLAVCDIPVGTNVADVQAKMKEKGYDAEIETENGYSGLVYYFFDPVTIDGMEISEISFVSVEESGNVGYIAMSVSPLWAETSLVSDPAKLMDEANRYFDTYKTPIKDMKNLLETDIESSGLIDGVPAVYEGVMEFYTLAFVNGEAVPVSSRKDATATEGAQVLDIAYISNSISEEYAEYLADSHEGDFSAADIQFVIGNAADIKYIAQNGTVNY